MSVFFNIELTFYSIRNSFILETSVFISGGTVSFGARGDSYYEYLLKQWLQTGQQRAV